MFIKKSFEVKLYNQNDAIVITFVLALSKAKSVLKK